MSFVQYSSIAVIPASNQTLPIVCIEIHPYIYPPSRNKSPKNHIKHHQKTIALLRHCLHLQRYGLLIFQRYKFISKTYSFASGRAFEAD